MLVLGGTAEASLLGARLAREHPEMPLVLSLAGRTRAPILPPGVAVRIGGFGGAAGLAAFLRSEGVTHLVDATHPFAVGMSRNAAEAAELGNVPRIALLRPAWEPAAGDRWIEVDCLRSARDALPRGATAFLALGAQHVAPFRHRPDLRLVWRVVDAPEGSLPFPAALVLGRPSTDPAEEAALFAAHGVTHLVCRNSGGRRAHAKIEAARQLKLPVVMIQRPAPPKPPIATDLDAVLDWLNAQPAFARLACGRRICGCAAS
ncbi:precorrin-6A/cobalt-precorrin-6A reductase [Aureimonas jatrophae]|uniref:Precorrin-6A/cobalt-precorrin-6A reductase n=1 Tax=Aureimonas jatrophae TaxID=1166073 RepID=A0A1H0D823_9HYPH|nr:precorrin-6A/cobalt-precorrin-6A reductase [Aureimonas jatrophae]